MFLNQKSSITFLIPELSSRKKSCLINLLIMLVVALPCILGYAVFTGFEPFGSGTSILDIEDFIVSNNILPIGSLIYVLFCTMDRKGWGWNQFLTEANLGQGLKFPSKLKVYCKYVLPVLLLIFWGYGLVSFFI